MVSRSASQRLRITHMARGRIFFGCACLALLPAASAMAQSTVSGSCGLEIVKGRPTNYVRLQDWILYFCRDGNNVTGQVMRAGASPSPRGGYSFSNSSGRYSLFIDNPLFYGRPSVVEDIVLPSSGGITRNVELPSDYLCAFGEESVEWGESPWTGYGNTWYQTFLATGTSITGINFKLAGSNATEMDVSILSQGAGNPNTWSQIGPTRRVHIPGPNFEVPVRFRSAEIPTVPGLHYALKLRGAVGSPDTAFAIYRRIEDGQGYANGNAINSAGNPEDFDIYAMIFSDNDHTVVPYGSRQLEQGELAGWAGRWCQEIKAMGTSLAGAQIYFAGGSTWDIPITFKVRSGGPNGTQVGALKIGRTSGQVYDTGFAGASWNRGEVPLVPGQKYYLEMSNAVGFNPTKFTLANNVYSDGAAYQSGNLMADVDLLLQVVEYVDVVPPAIQRTPASFARSAVRRNNLPPDTFTIHNSGGGSLSYTISDDASWLSVDPTEGACTTGTDTINVIYDTATLAVGSYNATITINAPGASNTPQTIAVSLSVTAPLFAPCDFDTDGDVDQADFGRFQACYSGAGVTQSDPNCSGAILDFDDDVDAGDFSVFLRCFSGPKVSVNTLCAD
jgi:hypothetical protein